MVSMEFGTIRRIFHAFFCFQGQLILFSNKNINNPRTGSNAVDEVGRQRVDGIAETVNDFIKF